MAYKTNEERRAAWKRWWSGLSVERQEAYRTKERDRTRRDYSRRKYDPAHKARKDKYHKTVSRFAKFGMTQEDFGYMMERCGGECPGCDCEMVGGKGNKRSCHIDHDHKTGVVRGLLCQSCNMALGYVKDCAGVLGRLQHYLKETRPMLP